MSVVKPTYELPPEIHKACETLSERLEYWPIQEYDLDKNDADVIDTFGYCEKGNQAYRRLLWLCMFVARRVISCWQLYCDTRQPQQTIQALENYLNQGIEPVNWNLFAKTTEPSFRGVRIVDCRACDTYAASESVTFAVNFLMSGNPDNVRDCIGAVDEAFDQSPLYELDNFRRWLTDFAIPIAYHEHEMTRDEQNAYRTYDPDEITPEE